MARILGDATVPSTQYGDGAEPGGAPLPARRGTRPGWRDPRLWVGVVLVAASVVIGARVLAGADDTVAVWAAAADLGAGESVGADDLVVRRVHFADAASGERYLAADEVLPDDIQLTRSVGAGELLARSAVGSAATSGLLELPISLAPEQVPPSVRDGSVVDVYIVAAAGQAGAGSGSEPGFDPGGPALSAVTVVDAPEQGATFGATGQRQIVVAVEEDQAQAFFALLARDDSPTLTVVRRG